MRTIRVSEDVWNEIAKRGKFGETSDDVLRQVFGIDRTKEPGKILSPRRRVATQRLSPAVKDGRFSVRFDRGPEREWKLPPRADKQSVRKITYEAMEFAKKNGATEGQILAVRKALTNAGYHLTK